MSEAAETLPIPSEPPLFGTVPDLAVRRADIDAKQLLVADLLKELGREGLLLWEPENFAWITSGSSARGILDPRQLPGVYLSAEQRWLVAANVDSQRLFDEEIDGLGFQLKEWPWPWDRDQYALDLFAGRPLACDRPLGDCKPAAEPLARLRRMLSPYEQSCLRVIGPIVAHAVEATGRTFVRNQTEEEVAGQLSHRLLHRGFEVVSVTVAADGRSRLYRRAGYTPAPIQQMCVLTATARKYGLCATASRMVCFGEPESAWVKECDTACKVTAAALAASRPRAVPRDILAVGRRVYALCGFEHEWHHGPQGYSTGRAAVEVPFTPTTLEMLQAGWAVTWQATVGAAASADTFLITEQGAESVTPPEAWPVINIRLQGQEIARPFILTR